MKDIKETLDKLVPEPARMSDWGVVLREARPRRRSPILQLAIATGVVGLAALFVVAPWKGSERVGILDRALAAVGDGPVLHVVLRGDWGGTQVDLETDDRKPLYGERELWYDSNRNLVHEISRFGGAIEHEEVFEAKKPASELVALSREYRAALENGTARVRGEGMFDGVPVYWITIRRLMLPDVADNRDHEFAEEVAISRKTFKPVATRAMRDRNILDGSVQRVLRIETVGIAEADFTGDPGASLQGRPMMYGPHDVIDFEQAARILGRSPFWLGPEHAGLPLGQTREVVSATGTSKESLVTGDRAAKIRRCMNRRTPRVCPRTTGSIAIRDGNVYEYGKATFGPTHTGVSFFYGQIGDDPTTFKKEDSVPLYAEPHIVVTETTDRELIVYGPPVAYVPPEGSVVLRSGMSGYLVRDGVYITIRAASDKQILEAARALRPMPSDGSGGGG